MSRMTKQELLEENEELRAKLEDIYLQIGAVLDFEEEAESGEAANPEDEEE